MSQRTTSETGERVEGVVKWFDTSKGYGFVLREDGGPDVLLHGNVLRNFGQTSVADGSRIILHAIETPRGRQAGRIEAIYPPESTHAVPLEDQTELTPGDLERLEPLPARIKWFDRAKGFGFANAYGARDDIFLHAEVLRAAGLAEMTTGEALVIRVVEGARGRVAVQILPWDHEGIS
ncbi:cold shock domain-containing protein [Salipiger sp. IMCC34102]|uniref:cold-shock protein n=1 Tax=Salipiger sp. IMCC34102 TaxID=2510647 RepID=UPI00101C4EF9|nr:cold shock domain-containing protein [Salipiger sp. IMCC34102]RYH03038.1 cold shock domain-containing protein [Salipiger sp. IMCC34102]